MSCSSLPRLIDDDSTDWFKGTINGKSHISWENLWFPVDVPLSQPIENSIISAHFAAIWPCLDGEVWLPLASGL